ncbi:hypothetical protein CRM22_005398 [Opisthorchis felineus]|uniref:Cyclic nucleotide-binding domain-containing protein n=1 Tax=Opisthorchis felineus TaxID=147828 RepID=A0A4S2LSN7_OPIFE|nr:hypothetical protein CRM22_005398 [Opisthorchis felineus]
MKLVEECGSEWRCANELIIREGDIGTCMYILLSGSASVYQLGDLEEDVDDRLGRAKSPNETAEEGAASSSEITVGQEGSIVKDTTILGRCVGLLQSGSIFGEVALIEECRRIASIVANPILTDQDAKSLTDRPKGRTKDDEDRKDHFNSSGLELAVQLVVIPRALYDKTVRSILEAQFRMRTDFVNQVPYFRRLNSRLKEQIILSLEMQTFEYGCEVFRAGSEYRGLYYIFSGEVCISVPIEKSSENQGFKHTPYSKGTQQVKFYVLDKNPMLSTNYGTTCLGDLETLLGCCPYLFTARATTESQFLFMTKRNAQRYFLGATQRRAHTVPKVVRTMQLSLCKEAIMKLEYRLASFPGLSRTKLNTYLIQLKRQANEQTRILRLIHTPKFGSEQANKKPTHAIRSKSQVNVTEEQSAKRPVKTMRVRDTSKPRNASFGQKSTIEDVDVNAVSPSMEETLTSKKDRKTHNHQRRYHKTESNEIKFLEVLNSEREYSRLLQSKVNAFVSELQSYVEKNSDTANESSPILPCLDPIAAQNLSGFFKH